MTARTNLLRDGYEHVAVHVVSSIAKAKGGNHAVVVRENGSVRIYAKVSLVPGNEEQYLVGTYSKSIPVEQIEDDCIVRLRELCPHQEAA